MQLLINESRKSHTTLKKRVPVKNAIEPKFESGMPLFDLYVTLCVIPILPLMNNSLFNLKNERKNKKNINILYMNPTKVLVLI